MGDQVIGPVAAALLVVHRDVRHPVEIGEIFDEAGRVGHDRVHPRVLGEVGPPGHLDDDLADAFRESFGPAALIRPGHDDPAGEQARTLGQPPGPQRQAGGEGGGERGYASHGGKATMSR